MEFADAGLIGKDMLSSDDVTQGRKQFDAVLGGMYDPGRTPSVDIARPSVSVAEQPQTAILTSGNPPLFSGLQK